MKFICDCSEGNINLNMVLIVQNPSKCWIQNETMFKALGRMIISKKVLTMHKKC